MQQKGEVSFSSLLSPHWQSCVCAQARVSESLHAARSPAHCLTNCHANAAPPFCLTLQKGGRRQQ